MWPRNQTDREPARRNWAALRAMLPSGLAMVWLSSKAQWFWSHRADLQFGWIVLILCLYLFWEAWESKPTLQYRWTFGGCLLLSFGVALLFVVQVYQAAFGMNSASLLGLALGVMAVIAANVHYIFDRSGLRHFAFAFLFFFIALPMPSILYNFVVGGLQSKVALIDVELLNLLGIPARRVGSLIQLPTCMVGIDEACSGIRSLQSTVMAALFIGYLTLKRTSLKLMLLGAGFLLAVLGNIFRSLFLSYMANARGLQALDALHDAAGWSILLFTAVGVVVLAWFFIKLEWRIQRHQRALAG